LIDNLELQKQGTGKNSIMIKKIISVLQSKVFSRIYIDTNTDYHNTILLSSLGRSGSTMVSNVINGDNGYRVIFEPFKQGTVKIAERFTYPTFVAPLNADMELLNVLNRILSGKIRTAWTDLDNKKIIASQRLIKDVRTNLMLGWIKTYYPDLPVILLIRNPFAVIESWMRLKWPADKPKKRLLQQEEELQPFLPGGIFVKYQLADTPLANHFYNWCINYYIVLQQAKEKNIHITFYENYLLRPEEEIKSLFAYLNKSVPENAISSLGNLSRTTGKNSPLRDGETSITAWRKEFTIEEIDMGVAVLKEFELDKLYDFAGTGYPANAAVYI